MSTEKVLDQPSPNDCASSHELPVLGGGEGGGGGGDIIKQTVHPERVTEESDRQVKVEPVPTWTPLGPLVPL